MTKEIVLINEKFFTALIEAINAAKKTIDLETYIFNNDEFGQQVAQALCAAAERKVLVRVLVDGAGTYDWGNELTKQLEKSGVQTRVYHPLPWFSEEWSRNANHKFSFFKKIIYSFANIDSRNHRKTCIIDGNIVFIGSANIIACHIDAKKKKTPLRDTTVKIMGVNPIEVTYAFDRAWGKVGFKRRFYHFAQRIDKKSIFLLNYTLRRRIYINRSLYHHIGNARKRLWIINAYFVANGKLLNRLTKAAKRGVDVKIILPGKYEIAAVSLVTRTFYTLLLEAGAVIYEYQTDILHDKTMIIDDRYSVGSSNLNYRSLIHDLEVEVIVEDSTAQAELENQFKKDLKHSKKITLKDVNKMPWAKRLLGRFLLLLKYWL